MPDLATWAEEAAAEIAEEFYMNHAEAAYNTTTGRIEKIAKIIRDYHGSIAAMEKTGQSNHGPR